MSLIPTFSIANHQGDVYRFVYDPYRDEFRKIEEKVMVEDVDCILKTGVNDNMLKSVVYNNKTYMVQSACSNPYFYVEIEKKDVPDEAWELAEKKAEEKKLEAAREIL